MKKTKNALLLFCFFIGLQACSKDRVILEKGAGFYEIKKKEIQTFDSMGNSTGTSSIEDFGTLAVYAQSGNSSSATMTLIAESLSFGNATIVKGNWQVGPNDEDRFVFGGKIFTLEGWGNKKVTITFRSSLLAREVFHLVRN